MKLNIKPGSYKKNPDLIDRRGELKRPPINTEADQLRRNKKANIIQEQMDKMDLRALKNILTKRNIENLEYAKGKRRH